MVSAIAGSVASAGISKLLGGGKSGGDGAGSPASVAQFQAGGLVSGIGDKNGKLVVRSDPTTPEGKARIAALDQTRTSFLDTAAGVREFIPKQKAIFGEQIGQLNTLLEKVKPGFGNLTTSRVQAVSNERDRALSDVVQDFASRGILGSSVAQNTIGSLKSEFAQREADVRASSFLEELDVTSQLLDKKFQTGIADIDKEMLNFQLAASLERDAANVDLAEFDKHLDLVITSMGGVQRALQDANTLTQELAIKNAQGIGNFAGAIGQKIGKAAGEFDFGSLFSGGSSSSGGFSGGFSMGSFG